jgi:hypothetical protein
MLLLLLCVRAQFPPITGQTSTFDTDVQKWARWGDTANLLRSTFIDEGLVHLQSRAASLAQLKGGDEWSARRAYVRSALNATIGRGLPPEAHGSASKREATMPLNAKLTGSYVHPTLNATLQMLHFESRPGFFVSAGLWTPAEDAPGRLPNGKRAGILYASGHSCQAWRRYDYPAFFDYQFLLLQLVRQGFVVLAYDPPSQGERGMYWTGTASVNGSITRKSAVGGCTFNLKTGLDTHTGSSPREHDYYARQTLLNNVTTSSIWVYDGMRALDYLSSRSDLVDPSRLGMAGCSGGGTQTMYLSALDDRITASSPACYGSDFAIDFTWQGSADGEQRWPGALPLGLNKADLAVARAPKPTHFCLTTNDGCFPLQVSLRPLLRPPCNPMPSRPSNTPAATA